MSTEKKIKSLSILGKEILNIIENKDDVINQAYEGNQWFFPNFILKALSGISYMLKEDKLKKWISNYQFNYKTKKDIGIIMAGNIPLVGFHDLIGVLLSGNRAIVKLSHNDDVLIPYIVNILKSIDPEFGNYVLFGNSIDKVHAVIATGSDNTARYFKKTFKNIPYIIRKNRTSCCILDGQEQSQDFMHLSDDIFSFFGLGCRNVSKIYIPENYNVKSLYPYLHRYNWIKKHVKYYNNYRFLKSKYPLEKKSFIDAGFFILLENEDLVSPISCIYYERYDDLKQLSLKLDQNISKIQCLVSRDAWYPGSISFGKAQLPEPWDYADRVDIMLFLRSL